VLELDMDNKKACGAVGLPEVDEKERVFDLLVFECLRTAVLGKLMVVEA
jgi:hypothetical protein